MWMVSKLAKVRKDQGSTKVILGQECRYIYRNFEKAAGAVSVPYVLKLRHLLQMQWAAKRWDAQNVSMLLKEFVDRNLLSTRKALRSLEHLSIRHHLRFVN